MMEGDPRRKGPRSPSAESDDSSNRRRSRKYDRDRSPSPRRSRYRRSRSRERRSGSRERRRNKDTTTTIRGGQQDWNKQVIQNQVNPSTTGGNTGYVPPIHNQYQVLNNHRKNYFLLTQNEKEFCWFIYYNFIL